MDLVGDFNAMLIVSSGGIPFDVAQNSLKLFSEQVMPELRKMSARSKVAA